jgi:PDZ domain-containing protein
VLTDGPSDGALEPGDIVVAVDGTPIATPVDVVELIGPMPPGSTVEVTVDRGGEQEDVTVTLGTNPNDPDRSYLGITLRRIFEAPFPIEFTLDGVGGPSAGLVFTLAIIDELTKESLTGGDIIAGTGTVDPAGNVGAIGGIGQKMDAAAAGGATLFLAPGANCAAVRDNTPGDLTVAAVDTVQEALDALAAHRQGRPVVGCGLV